MRLWEILEENPVFDFDAEMDALKARSRGKDYMSLAIANSDPAEHDVTPAEPSTDRLRPEDMDPETLNQLRIYQSKETN